MVHFVYILHSEKLDRFYIGETSNIVQRIAFHHNSLPYKYTAKAKDWTLFFTIECKSRAQAIAIEKHIKRMKSKIFIKNLARYPEMSQKLIDKYSQSEPR